MRRWAALLALLALPDVARAQPVVVSAGPEHVSLTVYRNPFRERGQQLDVHWLGGFALVTETRTLRLPAGPATIRFEGVADGIVPVSAIVEGLPGGVVEKNRDARLLSPAALVDGSLGRHVTLQRTDRKSGRVRIEDAVLVSGPANGVVVRTREGIEALHCSGLAEKPFYPAIPAGFSAKPVLSVATVSPAATTATVTLSYLASDFDWAASYVATVAPDGRSLDLFAWMTLANGNAEGFADAEVQAVAGRLNHADTRMRIAVMPLRLQCYPLGTTTSDLQVRERKVEDIVVTGSRRSMMFDSALSVAAPAPPPPPPPPEDLGDLKLYRAPEPVTVNANGQKQVALLARSHVPFERLYRFALAPGASFPPTPARIALRLKNVAANGLGVPLPAGGVALYARRGGASLLTGDGAIGDKAVGETVRVSAGWSPQVSVEQVKPKAGDATVTVSNANAVPATIEVAIGGAGARISRTGGERLPRVDGVPTWTVTIPAGGRASLTYHVPE